MSFAPDPDEALVAGVGRGDPASVRAFVSAKLPRMTSLALRMLGDAAEAEDVAQEVFVRAWRQARAWLPGPAKFDTWMHRVAMNLCYDRLRKRREVVMDETPEQVDEGPAPDAGLDFAEPPSPRRAGYGREQAELVAPLRALFASIREVSAVVSLARISEGETERMTGSGQSWQPRSKTSGVTKTSFLMAVDTSHRGAPARPSSAR